MIFLCTFTTALACSCLPSHPQQKFCRSHFVLRAKVVGYPADELPPNVPYRDNVPFYLRKQVYTLHVTKVYKGHSEVEQSIGYDQETGRAKLYTPSRMISCRVLLKKDQIYLVGGRLSPDGMLHANSCSWIRKWNTMTWVEKWNLQKYYKPNCNCRINTCFGEQGCKNSNKMACGFNVFSPRHVKSCRSKYQYCGLNSSTQSCVWYETSRYKQCIKKFP